MNVKQLKARVVYLARDDAMTYYREHHTALDPDNTDWDGTAWAIIAVKLNLTSIQYEQLRPTYQKVLIDETRLLMELSGD